MYRSGLFATDESAWTMRGALEPVAQRRQHQSGNAGAFAAAQKSLTGLPHRNRSPVNQETK
jgi:hypothetical protein